MLDTFLSVLNSHLPPGNRHRILLAVSGGIDSVVMADLFMQTGLSCGVAHCNFMLRGKESEEDEFFVKSLASLYGIPFFVEHFDTLEYAANKNLSVQMAARELRYDWFEKICHEYQYDLVALAHNRSDQVETLLLNLSRGTGIRGMSGMKVLHGNLFRPLLFAGRQDITRYAREKSLGYREDSSNRETYYTRNRIRHRIIPEFTEMNPRFEETMYNNALKFSDIEKIYTYSMDRIKSELLVRGAHGHEISITEIAALPGTGTLLYELLKGFHFTPSQAEDVLHSLDGPPGKQFLSTSHRLVRDRDRLIIVPLEETVQPGFYYIEEGTGEIIQPIPLSFRIFERPENYVIPSDPDLACLDMGMISFPLILRKWRQGDYFYPFGMNGIKKLSDFFVDRKYSLLDKERAWILAMGDRIVWIVGDRIDHHFRITPATREILLVRFHRDARNDS